MIPEPSAERGRRTIHGELMGGAQKKVEVESEEAECVAGIT